MVGVIQLLMMDDKGGVAKREGKVGERDGENQPNITETFHFLKGTGIAARLLLKETMVGVNQNNLAKKLQIADTGKTRAILV